MGSGKRISEDYSFTVREKRRKKKVPHMIRGRESGLNASLRFDKLMIEDNVYTFDLVNDRVVTLKRGQRKGIVRAARAHDDDVSS